MHLNAEEILEIIQQQYGYTDITLVGMDEAGIEFTFNKVR